MKSFPEVTAVILCAGEGTRAGLGYNKVLHGISNTTIAAMTASKFARFDRLVIVCAERDMDVMRSLITFPNTEFVIGGATRSQSVRNALRAIVDTDIVMIHDGARPFVTDEVIDASLKSALEYGSGIAAIPPVDAIKIQRGKILMTLEREYTHVVQTPQTFRYAGIKYAYDTIEGDYLDDSELYYRAGYTCTISKGDPSNVKLTSYRDFAGLNDAFRIGFGFDVHRLEEGRKLVLCGVTIPFEKGLLGHSDADAPIHAVMDAILSAAGLPDIGTLYPDNNPEYEGIASTSLLKDVRKRVEKHFELFNVSVCVIAEMPKLRPYIAEMRATLAAELGVPVERVNVSATTTERLGVTGEGKGIAAAADVLLKIK